METPADWSFARSPKWLLSHLFALTLIAGFLWAGFWQLNRLDERQAANELVESRALIEPVDLDAVLPASAVDPDPDDFDYLAVTVTGRFLEGEVVRVANRSQDGRGGDWVVGSFETSSGQILLVNRGFLLRSEVTAPVPDGVVELSGWLRRTRTKGWLGADDSGTGLRVPRLNIDDVSARLGAELVPAWLQLDEIDGADPSLANSPTLGGGAEVVPRPIPLDDLDEGNHFSYAMQWFAFALLSVVIYTLLLRKLATSPQPETAPGDDDLHC